MAILRLTGASELNLLVYALDFCFYKAWRKSCQVLGLVGVCQPFSYGVESLKFRYSEQNKHRCHRN